MLQSAASSSSRWRPTSEQLLTLEKLYANGVRSPDASQIHQITAHLSRYGKVEGKNVFYWFQNHKARERQKLRKSLISSMEQAADSPLLHCHFSHPSQILIHQNDATLKKELNLLCKLERRSGEDEVITHNEHEWMAMMDAEQSSSSSTTATTAAAAATFYSKPALETLDLFPTKSTQGRLNN